MRARTLVVGLGRIGCLHAANLAGGVPGAELAGVVDEDGAVARAAGRRFGVRWATDLDELALAAEAAVIAAPTALHVELVERCAGAGLHVLCEKPLGFDPAGAERATTAAMGAGVTLQVGFQRRFDPGWLALAGARRDTGEPRLLRISHRNASPPPCGDALGDLFADVAVHDLDAARWLCGEAAEVFAVAVDGWAAISLRFESGALGLVDVSRVAAYGFECSAELAGAHASARLDGGAGALTLLADGELRRRLAADHAQRHAEAYRAELRHFAAAAAGAAPPGPGGEEAAAALRLVERARESAATGTAR